MLKQIEFIDDWRCFKKGDTFAFGPGVNLLVGDQGSGKSSILSLIAAQSKARGYRYEIGIEKKVEFTVDSVTSSGLDFEHDNPRTLSDIISGAQILLKYKSHGQSNLAILNTLTQFSDALLYLDEPDMALSIRSICQLADLFTTCADKNCQIIAAVHNPILIGKFLMVYSLDHRRWMKSDDFITSQMEE